MNQPKGPSRVRLADVADRAGVSKSIASRVLNGREDLVVAAETRQRIFRAAEELDYQPNSAAQALSSERTWTIACVVPSLDNAFYAKIVAGAYGRALEKGYVVLMAEDQETPRSRASLERLVTTSRVDGLIMASAYDAHPLVTSMERRRIPHLYVSRALPGKNRNIVFDQAGATEAAVEYLANLGHSVIGHISGPKGNSATIERTTGLERAAKERGIVALEVFAEEMTADAGYDATKTFLLEHPEVTALYVSSLLRGVGAIHAVHDAGLRIPEDVSVLSGDDLPIAAHLTPPVTSMHLPTELLGSTAVDELIMQIEGGYEPHDVIVPGPFRIVEGASTAPPRPG